MLSFTEYKSELNNLPFGKRVGKNIYILWDDLKEVSPILSSIIFPTGNVGPTVVIKFFLDQFKISFLDYPDFFLKPHPSLNKSITLDLNTGKSRKIDYSKHENPPILHRKETMISPEREEFSIWQNITVKLEEKSCFEDANKIGFKQFWDKMLKEKGLFYEGHELKEKSHFIAENEKTDIVIERHRTAMSRSDFSKPVQLLIKNGLLDKESLFFDYGCGLGDDIRALEYNGYNATGWDPVYKPDSEKRSADVVNLGFVLNVIENPSERIETLQKAYNYTEKVLSVAVVTDLAPTAKNIRPYKDGFLTSRGTFQKYYKHEEAHEFIEEVLNCSAYSVAQGVFYIFVNEQDGQDFLALRQKRNIDWNKLNLHIYPSKDERDKVKKELLYEKHKEELESYWEQLLQLGRAPGDDEYPAGIILQAAINMNQRRLQEWFIERYGQENLEKAFKNRRDDLLVYLGLANFKRRVPYLGLSVQLQRDIKTFFGSYTTGQQEALVELYKIGNPDEIDKRCALFQKQKGIGILDQQALYLKREDLDLLDPVLRMYVGVAELLYGNVDEVDEIKIHKRSGKVTFFIKKSPDLKPGEYFRIKVDLRKQKVDFFRHRR